MKEKNFGQPSDIEEFPVEETTEELRERLEKETGQPVKRVIGKKERREDNARAKQAFEDFKRGQGELPLKN